MIAVDPLEPTDEKVKIPQCKICKRLYPEHSGEKCPACFAPIEHHETPADHDECWRGRARMADARRHSGQSMNATDHEALRRFPIEP